MMRGVLEDCFQITGRPGAVVALLIENDETLRAGDWMIIGGAKWRVAGIEFIKRSGVPTPDDLRRIAVWLDASKAELVPLIGSRFETISAQA